MSQRLSQRKDCRFSCRYKEKYFYGKTMAEAIRKRDNYKYRCAAAIIQVKEGMTLTEDEVDRFCTDLPRYKRPRKIIFADVLRNPTGKIDKPKLREIYCGEHLVERQNQS